MLHLRYSLGDVNREGLMKRLAPLSALVGVAGMLLLAGCGLDVTITGGSAPVCAGATQHLQVKLANVSACPLAPGNIGPFLAVIPNVPALFTPAGLTVSLDIGGVIHDFRLDGKGRARAKDGSFQLKLKMKRNKATKKLEFLGGNVPFKATVLKGTFAGAWLDEGVDPAINSKKQPLSMTVDMKFNGRVYTASMVTLYNAKAEKTGTFSGKNKSVPK